MRRFHSISFTRAQGIPIQERVWEGERIWASCSSRTHSVARSVVMPPLLGRYKERMDGIQALMGQFRIPKHLRRQLRKWVVRSQPVPRESKGTVFPNIGT